MIVIASGYFDPLHSGHVEYFKLAKQYAIDNCAFTGLWIDEPRLVVIVNTDAQAITKKGKAFMTEKNRLNIIEALKPVDSVFLSIDTDSSVCLSIEAVHSAYMNSKPEFAKLNMVFAKGGDRFSNEIPEFEVCERLGISIVDSLGAKIDSSRNYYDK